MLKIRYVNCAAFLKSSHIYLMAPNFHSIKFLYKSLIKFCNNKFIISIAIYV